MASNQNHDQASGIHYFLQGFKLINQKGLRKFVIIPFIINCLLFIGMIMLSMHYFAGLTDWLVAKLPSYLVWLNYLFWLVFGLALIFIIIYSFTFVANLVGAPFNSFLAEKVISLYLAEEAKPVSIKDFLKAIPSAILRQLQLLGYFIPRFILIFILFFIPIIQLIAPVIWFAFNSWMMSLQYCDYAAEYQHVNFKQMRQKLKKPWHLSLSFGILVMISSIIPIINFIIMPVAVAGGTALWINEYQQNQG